MILRLQHVASSVLVPAHFTERKYLMRNLITCIAALAVITSLVACTQSADQADEEAPSASAANPSDEEETDTTSQALTSCTNGTTKRAYKGCCVSATKWQEYRCESHKWVASRLYCSGPCMTP
ncbi:MAG TPA: hypothetical protein VLT33_01875 [Labilithrix sp.]|nr:hypothetical protein [Labilithrix sp.]